MHWIKLFVSEVEAQQFFEKQKFFTLGVNDQKVCIARFGASFYGFKSRCPHAGVSLSEGYINDNLEVVCPLHGYRFSLLDGREVSGHNCHLPIYPIEIRSDGVFLGWY